MELVIRLRFSSKQGIKELTANNADEAAVMIAVHEANGWSFLEAIAADEDTASSLTPFTRLGAGDPPGSCS